MRERVKLCALPSGQCGYIENIEGGCRIIERLQDLGFSKGAGIIPLYSDGTEHLRAYLVCGAVIALRREDARYVEVVV